MGNVQEGFLRHNLIFTTEAVQVRFVAEGEYLSFLNFDKCFRFFSKKNPEEDLSDLYSFSCSFIALQ